MKAGRRAFPSARLHAPASRSSLTSRSCKVLWARSTRPFAWLEFADDVEVQCMQRATKLGHAVAAERAGMIDPEHTVLVTVEGDRLAPGLQINAGRVEIGKGRFALDKLQVHQPAGRGIDEHQQRALRPAILAPPMLTAVDLHLLADAIAPAAGLVNVLQTLLAVSPNPSLDHPQ